MNKVEILAGYGNKGKESYLNLSTKVEDRINSNKMFGFKPNKTQILEAKAFLKKCSRNND